MKTQLILAFLVCTTVVYGQDSQSASEISMRATMAELRASREKIQSGVFRGVGRIFSSKSDNQGQVWNVFCAFDFATGRWRFEQETPRTDPSNTQGRIFPFTFVGYVRTPELALAYGRGGGKDLVLAIHKPDTTPDFIERELKQFDVRAIGLGGLSAMQEGAPLDRILSNYDKFTFSRITEDGQGVVKVEWVYPITNIDIKQRTIAWVDIANGFTLLKREERWEVPKSSQASGEQEDFNRPLLCEIKWDVRDGISIPKSFIVRESNRQLELTLTWETLNKPISGELFDKHNLPLDRSTEIFDHRSGSPVFVGTLAGK